MKSKIQILHVSVLAGRSAKTGNDYDIRLAQCIVHKTNPKTGVIEPLIGELMLPEVFKDIPLGTYEVEFEVAIDKSKRVTSQVCSMTPYSEGTKAANQAALTKSAA
jgi:hypothetical protein